MNIDLNQLRDLKSQAYDPTQFALDDSYFDDFRTKDFDAEGNLLEVFHENTKYTDVMDLRLEPAAVKFTTNPGFAFVQANLRPDYGGHELLELPDPETIDGSFTEVIEARRSRRDMTGEGISLQELSTLLYHSCGVTAERFVDLEMAQPDDEDDTDDGHDHDGHDGHDHDHDDHDDHGHDHNGHDHAGHDHDGGAGAGESPGGDAEAAVTDVDEDLDYVGREDYDEPPRQTFRSYASAGGLYPVENYVLVMQDGPNLPRGTYYYVPEKHGLRVLDPDPNLPDKRDELFALGEDIIDVSQASVVFTLTAAFWRAMAKYGPRCYRYIMQESGHLAQNALLSAEAMGLSGIPLAGFRDDPMNDHLGIDGVNESVIYTVAIGKHE